MLLSDTVQPTDRAGRVTKDERVRLHIHEMAGVMQRAASVRPVDRDASDIHAIYAAILGHHGYERLCGWPMRGLIAISKAQHSEITENIVQGVRRTPVVQGKEVGH